MKLDLNKINRSFEKYGSIINADQERLVHEINIVQYQKTGQVIRMPYEDRQGSTTLYKMIEDSYGEDVRICARTSLGARNMEMRATTIETLGMQQLLRRFPPELIICDYAGNTAEDEQRVKSVLYYQDMPFNVIIR